MYDEFIRNETSRSWTEREFNQYHPLSPIYLYEYICIYIHVYIYIYIFIYILLESGVEGRNQDALRSGFVLAVAAVGAGLLQGSWIHDHEWLAMSLVFLLGYVGIVFENLFEFNKAAIALLMSTALWVIYAGCLNALNCCVHYLCLRGWVYLFYVRYIDKIMKSFSML
jgi:hypothetical protein